MRPIRLFLVSLLLIVSTNASAYDNPQLARDAAQYLRAIAAKFPGKPNAQRATSAFNNARAHARGRRMSRAVADFERAIARGKRDPDIWYQLSNAWTRQRPPNRNRGLAAAFNGYKISRTAPERALGLWHIATHYENSARVNLALKAYEASLAARNDRRVKTRYDRLVAKVKLVVRRIRAEAESNTPRICVEFSKKLRTQTDLRFGDYVRLSPRVKMNVIAKGSGLCIDGITHGATYELTLLKGLPGENKLVLEKTVRFNVVVPNRSPSLAFKGSAFILPTKGRQGLPVTSVNVSRARVEVLRINDRAIVELIKERKITRLLSGYDASELRNTDGERVWIGTLSINSVQNKEVTTVIPVAEVLKTRKPGIYVAVASPIGGKPVRSWKSRATQWFVVTDLGVSTYMGGDGLHVSVRSLASAKPLEKINVLLVARNNEELGRVFTDEAGMARFAPGIVRGTGGLRPAVVMAFAEGGEFVFLDLTKPAFDLTDRGVGGRSAPGPVDAYLYTERGVYRPGETVHVVALLRDDASKALADVPVMLKLVRPDGVEARRYRLRAGELLGGHKVSIPLANSARTGRWTLSAYVNPKGKPVGSVRFQVEDFVPERLELTLKAGKPVLAAKVPNAVAVAGRFLYGAPAADLRVTSELVLRMNMTPYDKFKGYEFGLVQEEFRARRTTLKPARTDKTGRVSLPLLLDALPQTTRPLEAQIRVSMLEPGGRATVRVITLPVQPGALTIGIKKTFEGSVQSGKQAEFAIVALDKSGAPVATKALAYELIREEYRIHWYYRNNRWRYRVTMNEGETRKGTLDVGADPAKLAFGLRSGAYRLEIRDKRTGAASSVRFRVGWWASASAGNVPDKLNVTLDKTAYKAGETAKVFVKPPFAGRVQLVIAGDKVHETRNLNVSDEGRTIEIPVKADWGPSVYVLASAFRPGEQTGARGPARAIGLAHLTTDMSGRTLTVAISAPKTITPRRTVEVPIKVTGMARGGKAFVTLAAVDEGILQLTNYKSPKPAAHYYGKRRLALELRDDYGKLIDPGKGAFGRIRQGGDAATRRHLSGLDASSIKTVALFSGIVRVDGEGNAVIKLDVPDFNGRLRLMAVAWDGDKVGSGETAMTVRDPIVSIVTLPRFLAPRDAAQMTVSLHNVDGAAGAYKLTVTGTLAKPVGGNGVRTVQLAKDQRRVVVLRLGAAQVGVGRISMELSGPNNFKIARGWDLAVRAAQPVATRRFVKRIAPGGAVGYNQARLASFVPGTAEITMGFSTVPDLNLAGLIKRLDRYPYGCAEQTTSRALPLLYVADIARNLGVAEDRTILRGRVQKAVGRLLTMQRSDGSFGLWSSQSSREEWLTAYVMDFLIQAERLKYPVPEYAHDQGLKFLARQVADPDFQPWQLPAKAYAFYVLAQAGKARIGDLRYFHDTYLKQMPTALSMAQTGAALALAGDSERAAAAFQAAFIFKTRPNRLWRNWAYWDYGSNLRDRSGLVYLADASKQAAARLPAAVADLVQLSRDDTQTSTQEQAWLLLAAKQLIGSATSMKLNVGGRQMTRAKPLFMLRKAAALGGAGLTVRNLGNKPIWHSATVSGVPKADQPKASQGFTIKRAYYSLDGKRADLATVRQGDVLVAVISGEAVSGLRHQALVVDLLPAGFEIENARLRGRKSTTELKWLPKLTRALHVQPRDDRFVAALNLSGGGKRAFTLAYLVRAVTPGTFRLPAAFVEDMYKPRFYGRDAMGSVTIAAVR
ncbi:MAG: alpha-2-macroglobulin family protein [Alphaproteobacteria bacterium]|nr:alpha-2-macroglobulin family protein [Alphaproteobacteria bacterium]